MVSTRDQSTQEKSSPKGPQIKIRSGEASVDFDLDPRNIHSAFAEEGENEFIPQTPSEAFEHQAIESCNRLFDKWLRNIASQHSSIPESPPRRRLKNGLLASPTVRDINWQIALKHKQVLKERPIPLEMLTSKSFYSETPYKYLQLIVVNPDIRSWYIGFVMRT